MPDKIFITETETTGESGHRDDCDFAVIRMTQQLAQLILERREAFLALKAQEPALKEITFWGKHASYYSESVESDVGLHGYEDLLPANLYDDLEVSAYIDITVETALLQRIDAQNERAVAGDHMCIRKQEVYFLADPDMDYITINSRAIPYTEIESCL